MIKVLLEGKHTNTYSTGHYRIEDFTSSVTLVRLKEVNLLVDTGTLAYREKLLEALSKEGISPEDINYIFNTHFHLDHTSNNTLFKNAKQVSEHSIFDLKTGKCDIFHNRELIKDYIPKEIEVLLTPGHFKNHCSILYSYEGKNYVMAGDVVREDIIRGDGFSANGVSQTFYNSMKLVFEKADVIIPGHGGIIEGKLLDELRSVVINEFPKRHGLES